MNKINLLIENIETFLEKNNEYNPLEDVRDTLTDKYKMSVEDADYLIDTYADSDAVKSDIKLLKKHGYDEKTINRIANTLTKMKP